MNSNLHLWIDSDIRYDFPFSMKLDLLEAFKVIPHHILLCAAIVRVIRLIIWNWNLLNDITKKSAGKLKSFLLLETAF